MPEEQHPTTTRARRPRPSRKEEILECFAQLVAERGYDKVSLRDIAGELDISKGTILHHFGSKDKMLERVHVEYMTRRLAEAKAIVAKLPTPALRVNGIIHQLMISQNEDWWATVAFAREIVRFASEEQMQHVRSMRDEYMQLMVGIIEDGIAEGTLVTGEADLVALQIFGMCNWSWTWFRPDGRWAPEHIADSFVRTLLGGLGGGTIEVTDEECRMVIDVVRETMAEVATAAEATPVA